jgi:outer membrane protein
MKKQLYTLTATLLIAASLFTFSPAPAQAEDSRIGVVDTQQILTNSDLLIELKKAEQALQTAEKQLYESRNAKLKELEKARTMMKEDEFLKKKQQLETSLMNEVKTAESGLEKKKLAIQKMKVDLEKTVQDIVKAVAQKHKLEIVINKQLVLFGGLDITQEVVDELKKKK